MGIYYHVLKQTIWLQLSSLSPSHEKSKNQKIKKSKIENSPGIELETSCFTARVLDALDRSTIFRVVYDRQCQRRRMLNQDCLVVVGHLPVRRAWICKTDNFFESWVESRSCRLCCICKNRCIWKKVFNSSIHWFIISLIHWFIDSLIYWFIDSLIH